MIFHTKKQAIHVFCQMALLLFLYIHTITILKSGYYEKQKRKTQPHIGFGKTSEF